MTVYAVIKNDEIVCNRLFSCLDHAIDFLCEKFLEEFPCAHIRDIIPDIRSDFEETGSVEIAADFDIWKICSYVRTYSEDDIAL